MGYERESIPTLFSTATDWTLVRKSDCTEWYCSSYPYYYPASEGFTYNLLEEYWNYEFYNGQVLETQAATDTICLADDGRPSSCTTDFKWLVGSWIADFRSYPIGAMVGLSSGGIGNTDRLLMYSLYDDGVISENKFSVALKDFDAEETLGLSHIDFGPPDITAMSDESDLIWFDVIPGDFYWSNYVSGIKFDGLKEDVDSAFSFS